MAETQLLVLAAAALFSVVLLAGIGLFVYRETQRTLALDRRLSVPRRVALAAGLGPAATATRRTGGGGVHALARTLARAGSMLVPVGAAEREKLAQALRQAGLAQRDALSVFLSVKLAVGLAAGAVAGTMAARSELLGQYGFAVAFAALAGFVLGGVVPEYALRMRIARRAQAMGAALPDALDLTVMGLESGLTFERTLVTVAEELRPIEANLATELGLMEAELRVGAERRVVLEAFQSRSRVEGLRDLAMTLIQSERFGTPLTQSMKNIAANERTQRAARIEAAAQRLPVLMTLPMLLFVVPGTMCLVAGPAFLTAMQALGSLGGG
ncbi:MAG: type II secretion system F family protein [Chloroflexota bacterium]|nr:type II secretion system F family protein [Chloroflexota bacterium]